MSAPCARVPVGRADLRCKGSTAYTSRSLPRYCRVCSECVPLRPLRGTFFTSGVDRLLGQRNRKQDRKIAQGAKAAIFGVGAPEALLVGVVALVVFGPKGLAQAVKSLGATLRTFSPTIRELASVTNELSSTLQEQIGLDEIRNEFRNPAPPPYRSQDFDTEDEPSSSTSTQNAADTSEEAAQSSPDSEEELAAKIEDSKRLAWGGAAPPGPGEAAGAAEQAEDPSVKEFARQVSAETGKAAKDLSIEELEAELKRRREASKA